MKFREQQLTATDQTNIQTRLWEPDNEPKAVVCLIHGFGEHIGRYEHVAKALTDADYVVFGLDSRGHGKSAGPRGFIPSYEQYLDDVTLLLDTASEQFPNHKIFLYGHSTGGGLVLRYVLENRPDIAGVISSSPWILLTRDPGFLSRAVMWIFSFFRPTFTVNTGHTPGLLSRDPAVDEAFVADPLTHGSMTAGLLTGGLSNGHELLKRAADFPKIPLLQLHGTADPITSFKASQTFTSQTPTDFTTFISFPDAKHELHNDICQNDVFETIINWLDARLS